MSEVNHNLKPLVDQIGILRAQMATLAEQENVLVTQLQNAGVEVLEGNQFRITLTKIAEWKGPDWKAIAKKLNPSRQLIAANTRVMRKEHTRVNVSVRKGVFA
jgi:hypothetical protein